MMESEGVTVADLRCKVLQLRREHQRYRQMLGASTVHTLLQISQDAGQNKSRSSDSSAPGRATGKRPTPIDDAIEREDEFMRIMEKAKDNTKRAKMVELQRAYRLTGYSLFALDAESVCCRFDTCYEGKYLEQYYAIVSSKDPSKGDVVRFDRAATADDDAEVALSTLGPTLISLPRRHAGNPSEATDNDKAKTKKGGSNDEAQASREVNESESDDGRDASLHGSGTEPQRVRLLYHTLPSFLPIDELSALVPRKTLSAFLERSSAYLQAFVSRREQLKAVEGTVKRRTLKTNKACTTVEFQLPDSEGSVKETLVRLTSDLSDVRFKLVDAINEEKKTRDSQVYHALSRALWEAETLSAAISAISRA